LLDAVDISATIGPGLSVLIENVPPALVVVLVSPGSHTPLSFASKQTLADW